MSTLIINGSPKRGEGNTSIFIEKFLQGAQAEYEVRRVCQEKPEELADYLEGFETVLFFMPLYVHAMPGSVMKLFEKMRPSAGKKVGFVLQYGFVEGHQAQYAKRYFEALSLRLQYTYLGTAVRGDSAGVVVMPEKMNKTLFAQLAQLGAHYAQTGAFDPKIVACWAQPHTLKKSAASRYEFLYKIGLGNIVWHQMLRHNKAMDQRRDKPFAEGN